ncbi:phage portal protein [Acinetobacter sichuanensis]|uniref:phage portal protein n=1 Tax=Acinetobacter sichuanensis TaxID=2136183 RepID=UPI00280F2B78|nr:phage portal protein [Acinetobacter sichuanensis]MDQ9019910.1 phage portal protein [Acinetobacter sichuanensis]
MGFFDRLLRKKSLSSVNSGGGWTSLFVHEPFTGAWQHNQELKREDMASFYAVFACISLISKDMGKMPILLKKKKNGVLVNVDIPDRLSFFKKPNKYQTWQQFNEFWTTSLLRRGNAYIFKQRDAFGNVIRLMVLNPDQVKPLVDSSGNVFYQLGNDDLNQTGSTVLPASEIIHDRINCLYHPLVGLSPLIACGVAAGIGLNIQSNSSRFFGNMSRPSGILTAPGPISDAKAATVGAAWNANYSGQNIGKTAVLGDGLMYQPISMTAAEAQMIEQLNMSARTVCVAFNVHPYKIGLVDVNTSVKISDSNETYFSDCLQSYVESRENLFDESLDLASFGVEAYFDTEILIRMDSASQMNRLKEGVGAAIVTPNEARQKLGYQPLKGGDTVYMQQQNFSLEALSKRDQKEDPFGKAETPKAEPKSQYQGVFKSENSYEKGCFVTHKGSLWHCENDHLGEFSYENFKLAQKKWGDE